MADPDLEAIATLLTVVESRDPATVPVSRLDEDHHVLLSTQGEIVDVLAAELPAGYDVEGLRALLDRIVNDIERNRELRAAVAGRNRD